MGWECFEPPTRQVYFFESPENIILEEIQSQTHRTYWLTDIEIMTGRLTRRDETENQAQ